MGESGVHEYVERSRALLEGDPQMGEENTKVKLVQPLIDLLGWDVYSPEVELEYSMQIGRGHTRADYALLLEGTPVVFVEVNGCDATLTDTDRHQLKSYMRQMGVDWGLLTNGAHFEVLKRRVDGNRPNERSLRSFRSTNSTRTGGCCDCSRGSSSRPGRPAGSRSGWQRGSERSDGSGKTRRPSPSG
jgi:predicted type IV restriction endonuclease